MIGAFAPPGIMFIKMIGVGMVIALLVDATVVRALLVPATMRLLGRANWWAPGPLRASTRGTASGRRTLSASRRRPGPTGPVRPARRPRWLSPPGAVGLARHGRSGTSAWAARHPAGSGLARRRAHDVDQAAGHHDHLVR